jgi:hypothetical protein
MTRNFKLTWYYIAYIILVLCQNLMKNNSIDEDDLRNELTVFISNLSEDVWPFIQAMSDPAAMEYEIYENGALADLHLFSNADEPELLFISPYQLKPSFVDYFKTLFKPKYLETLSPVKHTGQTSLDVIADQELIAKIKEIAKHYKKVTLLPYSSTYQFYELKNYLIQLGLPIYAPESPADESAWTVNFFGSKSGIRQLGQKSSDEEPDFIIPDGLICVGIHDAAKIAADKYIDEDGVVLKTNKGHSGAGVLIFREGELPTEYAECEKALVNILKKDKYWDEFPIIIEDLVNINTAVAGGFPNVEFKIQKSGEINFLYCCGLRVTKDGIFQGTEISNEITNERYLARIMDLGFFIGEQYANAGYRGYFDVDMIAAKSGKIFVSESNTRRTGGTYVYKTIVKLLGKDFLNDYYVVHENGFKLQPTHNLNFDKLLVEMHELLFDPIRKQGIVFPSNALFVQDKLAYIVISDTKKHCEELEHKMKAVLAEIK